MNRRHLLRFASAVMLQSYAIDRVRAATSAAGTRTPEEIATDEDFWSEIRAAFTVDRNVINLNNGYIPHDAYNGLRITPNIYSTIRDIDTFTDAIEKELA
jgi:selenocysteine lyase/cysteine desulfurase